VVPLAHFDQPKQAFLATGMAPPLASLSTRDPTMATIRSWSTWYRRSALLCEESLIHLNDGDSAFAESHGAALRLPAGSGPTRSAA
jgi:hypothetical protein